MLPLLETRWQRFLFLTETNEIKSKIDEKNRICEKYPVFFIRNCKRFLIYTFTQKKNSCTVVTTKNEERKNKNV